MKLVQKAGGILLLAAIAVGLPLFPAPAGAEHFEMAMRAQSGRQLAEAPVDTTPPIGGVNPRPVLRIKVGDPVRISWTLKSNFPHGVMKNVTIHFFVVREQEPGQKPTPDPAGPAGVLDNRFVMDFSPTAASSGALNFSLPAAGAYLVRVQSEDTHQEHDHEHFSALDIVVQ